MSNPSPLPSNLTALLEQRSIKREQIEYEVGWNPEAS